MQAVRPRAEGLPSPRGSSRRDEVTEHGLSPQQAERSLRRQCLFLRSLQQAEPVPRKRSVFLQVPVQLSWCRPFSFCVRQSFPAAALLPPGQSSAPRRAQCSGRRQRQRLRPRSDPSLEKRRLQSADPLFFLQRAPQQPFPQAVPQRRAMPLVLPSFALMRQMSGIPWAPMLPAPPKRHGQSARQLLLLKLRQPQKI